MPFSVVVATAKVQIFKQITTAYPVAQFQYGLLLLPQRYKFSSKSQRMLPRIKIQFVVVATAKVQIFKQITTIWSGYTYEKSCCCYRKGTNFQANHNLPTLVGTPVELLLLPQRYKFSSKSQPVVNSSEASACCCCYRKGTNFQANHNCRADTLHQLDVVVATAKVQIFKQITTARRVPPSPSGCCCYRKGTNFQANHNHRG